MDADWSVELAPDAPVLEFPWTSPEPSLSYIDLQDEPASVAKIEEAVRYPELAEFLFTINLADSPWLTAKCDVWHQNDLAEAEAIYGASLKMCSYVDLVARDIAARFSFERHETWAKLAAQALSSEHVDGIACEFIVRRCWFHTQPEKDLNESMPGFYVTFYLFGYGADESGARTNWANGLRQATEPLASSAL